MTLVSQSKSYVEPLKRTNVLVQEIIKDLESKKIQQYTLRTRFPSSSVFNAMQPILDMQNLFIPKFN